MSTERVVVNVDGLWGADPRWYRFGDVCLGDRGVPQLVVFYAVAGVILGWLATRLPILGLGFWPTGTLLAITVAGLGFVRPGGLRVHQFLPAAAAFLTGPRHLHGWQPCPPPQARWRPEPLVLEGDGSRPHFEALAFTGPGLLVRHRPARRTAITPAWWQRAIGRSQRQVLQPLPGPRLPVGREVHVPAGVTVLVRESL